MTPMRSVQLTSPVLALSSVGPMHDTLGLPGFPAHDWFAPAGSSVVSPDAGVVSKLSGHPPSDGPIAGPHGPFGWSVYVQAADGTVYYLTHLGLRSVRLHDRVKRGAHLGTVAPWHLYGTPDHIHMGVSSR